MALECQVESETFNTPVWTDVLERFQPMLG